MLVKIAPSFHRREDRAYALAIAAGIADLHDADHLTGRLRIKQLLQIEIICDCRHIIG